MPSTLQFILVTIYSLCSVLISKQTVYNHEYITDLDELLEDARTENDEAIYGNPLLTNKCANALLDEHKYNIDGFLRYKGLSTPWFWSRESLDATIRDEPLHRRLKITHAVSDPKFIGPWSSTIANRYSNKHKGLPGHIERWYNRLGATTEPGNTYKDDYEPIQDRLLKMNDKEYQQSLPNNVFYYHIPKTGSSSIGSMLMSWQYNRSFISENMISHTQCGFTFVREPISRFVSGYYTVNRLIYFHNLPGVSKKRYEHDKLFNWFNVSGEPARFTQFVEDLLEFDYEFVETSPLEHMMTQSGILSIAQNDIHFVGKLHKMRDHWSRLHAFCDSELLQVYPKREYSRMKNYGVHGIKEHPEYAKLMSLEDYEDGDLLPAYKVVADSYDLYHKIANYYKQDFVCFGFEMDYQGFRDKMYGTWNGMIRSKEKMRLSV